MTRGRNKSFEFQVTGFELRISADQIDAVAALVASYISQQRDRLFPSGRRLSNAETAALAPFFGEERLRCVRIQQLKSEELRNPDFYPQLQQMGFKDLPDFAHMAAITFVDAVAFREEVTLPVLFHELVHVVQYELLGVGQFVSLYVEGFLNGGGYEGIPLEKNAYELDARFSANPKLSFEVEAEVRAWKDNGRF